MRALILAGGSGSRFWPASRRLRPKQLLSLEGGESLLRQTLERLAPIVGSDEIWICTTRTLAEKVRAEAAEVPPHQVLAEPEGRNTAAAIGWSIGEMGPAGLSEVVAVLPADHRIGDAEAFRQTLDAARRLVESEDRVMTLGVKPRWAETGFGYLELEHSHKGRGTAAAPLEVLRFTEKPDAAEARSFVESGRYLWNAGIFVFRGGRLLELLAEHQPELSALLERIRRQPASAAELYSRLPSISIDYAVMEKCSDLATLPLDCEWSDLGSWDALREILDHDSAGNAIRGEVVCEGGENNLLVAERGTIAAVDVSNLVVVQTGDAVLIAPRGRSQEVKRLVSRLQAEGRDDLL